MKQCGAVVVGQCQRKTKVHVEELLQKVLPSGAIINLPLREKTEITNSSVCATVGTLSSTQSHEIQVCQRCHRFRMSPAIRNQKVSCNFYFPTMRTTGLG